MTPPVKPLYIKQGETFLKVLILDFLNEYEDEKIRAPLGEQIETIEGFSCVPYQSYLEFRKELYPWCRDLIEE